MAFLLHFFPVHSYPHTVLPPASGLRDMQKLQEEARKPPSLHLPSVKNVKAPGQVWRVGEKAGGHPVVPEGIHSPEVPHPIPLEGGPKVWGWKGREGQRRREDKPAVICLFNWLRHSEESCVVILALGLDQVQAPGFGRSVGCRRRP